MADSSLIHFCCLGRFADFVAGTKSPYAKMALQAVQFDDASGELIDKVIFKLDKSLRKKLKDSLQPDDWVKVTGEGKAISKRDRIKWKADKVSKLSPSQLEKHQAAFAYHQAAGVITQSAESTPPSLTPEITPKNSPKISPKISQVLICQKGSCRKKGSLKVAQAVEAAIQEAGCAETVKIKATSCMGHCKSGPNMVFMPTKKSYRKVSDKKARSLIKAAL